MRILSYGAGTNSTAILAGLLERGECLDAIVFADTGGEKPHTYEHLKIVSNWCESVGFPKIVTVVGDTPKMRIDKTLEGECARLKCLPSKAYGYGTCSQKWKLEPQRRYFRELANSCGLTLANITVLVGFDADEESRVARGKAAYKEGDYRQEYPLYEWGWTREDCVEAIARVGLPQPGKSACFFCPSTKKPELLELREQYPELVTRALQMEARALKNGFEGKGLGRNFNWADFLAEWDAANTEKQVLLKKQIEMFDPSIPEIACACID